MQSNRKSARHKESTRQAVEISMHSKDIHTQALDISNIISGSRTIISWVREGGYVLNTSSW